MLRPKNRVQAELYIGNEKAKPYFYALREMKEQIEVELGYALGWEELPDRRDCRIAAYLEDTDPEDREDWARQHAWLAKALNDLHRVFSVRVRRLDPDEWDDGDEAAP